jgi:Helix-loop-helix DNA-binding domain
MWCKGVKNMSDSDSSQQTTVSTSSTRVLPVAVRKTPKAESEATKKRKYEMDPSSRIQHDDDAGNRKHDAIESNDLKPEDLSRLSRSERKRHREKKRRSDVNKGFDDLMSLLVEIDPDIRAEAEDRVKRVQYKSNMAAAEENLLSRVDLIARTVEVLRRVHQENEENKKIISNLLGTTTRSASATVVADPVVSLLQDGFPGSSVQGSHHLVDVGPSTADERVRTDWTPFHCSNS